jgi:hypothetical protein
MKLLESPAVGFGRGLLRYEPFAEAVPEKASR